MELTDDAATRPPSVMLIDGREYMLYDQFFGRIRMAEVKLLWLYSSMLWAVALVWTLQLPFTDAWWPLAIAIALLLAMIAAALFMYSRPTITIPATVVERDRNGATSRLSVSTGHGTFSVTAHTDMADFLLGAITTGRRRRLTPRREVPAGLVHPKMMRHVWSGTAVVAVMITVSVARVVLRNG